MQQSIGSDLTPSSQLLNIIPFASTETPIPQEESTSTIKVEISENTRHLNRRPRSRGRGKSRRGHIPPCLSEEMYFDQYGHDLGMEEYISPIPGVYPYYPSHSALHPNLSILHPFSMVPLESIQYSQCESIQTNPGMPSYVPHYFLAHFPPMISAHNNNENYYQLPEDTIQAGVAPSYLSPTAAAAAQQSTFSAPTVVEAPATVDGPIFGPGPPIITGDQIKGPRGCNLFVFHLPNEITNWDLYLLFRRFGTILSVHIMVNQTTGLSKGYGFVSFTCPEDASNAIEEMDGFRLGKKRLKVQLKRLQDDNTDGEWEDNMEDTLQLQLQLQSQHSFQSSKIVSSGSGSSTSPSSPRSSLDIHVLPSKAASSNEANIIGCDDADYEDGPAMLSTSSSIGRDASSSNLVSLKYT